MSFDLVISCTAAGEGTIKGLLEEQRFNFDTMASKYFLFGSVHIVI